MNQMDELWARKEIAESLMRYARGVDRRDWEAVRACYHADATDWHGEYRGSVDGFITWVSGRHAPIEFSMHFLGNCLIDFFDDRTAAVETYFVAMQRRDRPNTNGDALDTEVFGRYCDRFEKRDGQWRVADRQVVYDNTRTQPSSSHLRKVMGALGQRNFSDPVFHLKTRTAP